MWSARLWPTARVYIGDEDGDLVVLPLKADFDPKNDDPIFETNMLVPIYSTPVVANGCTWAKPTSTPSKKRPVSNRVNPDVY